MDDFEERYLECRDKEGRLYADEIVKQLPFISNEHKHFFEWQIRANSAQKLNQYAIERSVHSILDIGCGNGWMSNYLQNDQVSVVGIDVNCQELTQAQRIFPQIEFIYGDITKEDFILDSKFDMVVIASVVQYFPSIEKLIRSALQKITDGGEIHILDSPIYVDQKASVEARHRSDSYFSELKSEMAKHYFHHSVRDFQDFDIEWISRPHSIRNKLNRLLKNPVSPFPWLCIKKP